MLQMERHSHMLFPTEWKHQTYTCIHAHNTNIHTLRNIRDTQTKRVLETDIQCKREMGKKELQRCMI